MVRRPVALPARAEGVARVAGNAVFAAIVVAAVGVGLMTVGPRFLPYQVLPVLTGSMQPELPVGSLAVVVPVQADRLTVGDVITFQHPIDQRSYVTHRIVGIVTENGSRMFITKGDANALPDAWRVMGTGSGWRVAFDLPTLGGMLVGFQGTYVRSGIIGAPLVLVAALALYEIWRPRRRVHGAPAVHEERPAAQAA